jgi:hypothetical protein
MAGQRTLPGPMYTLGPVFQSKPHSIPALDRHQQWIASPRLFLGSALPIIARFLLIPSLPYRP